MKITKKVVAASNIFAADIDKELGYEASDDLAETLGDVSDSLDDLQDTIDDIEEDDVEIETENNIENHYIAVCDRCHGFFVSAVQESDQEIASISGVCPLCGKESDQSLDYVIKRV